MSSGDSADTVARFVGARLIAGDSIPEIVAKLDEQLSVIRREYALSLIHISEPTRLLSISYAVFCLKKKKKK